MRITHDWPFDRVKRIMSKAFDALPSGGRLLIYETFKNDGKVAPGDQAIISLLLMLISPAGECRSFEDMRTVLKEVGFGKVEFIPTVFIYSMIVAEKP
jgi:acetylserotonin N-methyltransferase